AVAGGEEQGDGALAGAPAQLGDPLLVPAELLDVGEAELLEALRQVGEPGAQLGAGGEVFRPVVDRRLLARDPPRPEPVDEDPEAVAGLGPVVDALEPDRARIDRRRRRGALAAGRA